METSALQEELDGPWSDMQEELMLAPIHPYPLDHAGAFFCSKSIATPLYRSQVVPCLDGVWTCLDRVWTIVGPLFDHGWTMFGFEMSSSKNSWDSTCGGFPGCLGETAAHGPPPKKHTAQGTN